MSAAFTEAPWQVGYRASDVTALDGRMKVCDIRGWGYLTGRGGGLALEDSEAEAIQIANARLIAAAPELYDGCNAMLGLVQLILGRDDLSAELREVLTTNHRLAEAEAATAKARGES